MPVRVLMYGKERTVMHTPHSKQKVIMFIEDHRTVAGTDRRKRSSGRETLEEHLMISNTTPPSSIYRVTHSFL